MAARRSSKRTRRRRGRFGFLYKALSLVLILAAIVAGCIVFFRVNDVAVSGESKYTAQEIIDVTGVQQGDNLLLLPRNQIVKRILTQLPYVSNVNLRLSLPDTLLISVTECAPAALVQGGEGWWIIDARGKLLEQVSAPTVRPDLAKVTGITALLPTAGTKLAVAEEEQTKLSSLTRLLTAMENRAMLGRVGAIDMTAAARLTFLYDGRITVKLPLVDEKVEAKLEGLERAMESIQDNERGTLDLTRDIGERWYFDPE